MGQLTQVVIYFNDSIGNIAPGSRHFFYDAGTTTPKAVYSDPDLITPIDQPVLADSAGILPQIWLESGAYRWVGELENSVQIFDRDNVNLAETAILTSSSFVFKNESDLANLFLTNGESVNPQDDQSVFTQGEVIQFDSGGRQFVVGPTDLGSAVALSNGKFANPQSNFTSITDVNDLISTHNNDVSAHSAAIDAKISTHNNDVSAHPSILSSLERRITVLVESNGSINFTTTSSDGVSVSSVTKGATGQYILNYSSSIKTNGVSLVFDDLIVSTGDTPYFSVSGVTFSGAFTLNNQVSIRKSSTGGGVDGAFLATIFYTGEPQ